MQDAAFVRGFECADDLKSQWQRSFWRQRPLEWSACDEFKDEVIRTNVVDLTDVGMVSAAIA